MADQDDDALLTVASLLDQIAEAFSDVRPGAITIHEADLLDIHRFSEEERQAARMQDKEARWQDVPDSTIFECRFALSFLDVAGWRYYIPAFMRWSLRQLSTRNYDDSTIYTFSHNDPDSLARYQSLSNAQSLVVCRFLRFMAVRPNEADADVAESALESYWSRFEDTETPRTPAPPRP